MNEDQWGPLLPTNITELIDSDIIRCVLSSKINPEMLYIGTFESLLIINRNDPLNITKINIKYGVHKIFEFQHDILILYTWSGLRVIDMTKNK